MAWAGPLHASPFIRIDYNNNRNKLHSNITSFPNNSWIVRLAVVVAIRFCVAELTMGICHLCVSFFKMARLYWWIDFEQAYSNFCPSTYVCVYRRALRNVPTNSVSTAKCLPTARSIYWQSASIKSCWSTIADIFLCEFSCCHDHLCHYIKVVLIIKSLFVNKPRQLFLIFNFSSLHYEKN